MMKGLKIIPLFAIFLVLSYVGTLFVKANFVDVSVNVGFFKTPSAPVGLVVLTSVLLGMIIIGIICSFELFRLAYVNNKLNKKIKLLENEFESSQKDIENLPEKNDSSLNFLDEKEEGKKIDKLTKNGTREY